jgi:hypothetical protein
MITMRKLIATLAGILAIPGLSLWLALPAGAAPAGAAPARAALAAASGTGAATSCGIWRWPVKTGSDADRRKVDKTVVDTTIRHLRRRTAPSSFAGFQNHRFRGAERHTYRLRARLTQFRLEDDGDIHLVLQNRSGKDMIAEIPRPGCVARSSLWKRAIRAARSNFTNHYQVTTSWQYVNRRIRIRGLGFFDEIHNVTGQAPNGIELHPVTRIRFR